MSPFDPSLSAGKRRASATLADEAGCFTMVAVDQRPPIFVALALHGDRDPAEVRYTETAAVKGALVEVLAPHASAVLMDPVWTHLHSLRSLPGRLGLLSTLEDHRFEAEHELAFVLELLTYPRPGEDPGSIDWAHAKPGRVLGSIRHYGDPRFRVDLLELEFPVDLKRVDGFHAGALDGVTGEAAHDPDETRGHLQALDAASPVPWVLLSAGVGPREFALNVDLAIDAGASGVLAGRAVWYDALATYPDLEAVKVRLRARSVPFPKQLRAIVERGVPWHLHRRFRGAPTLADASPDWSRGYR